MSDQKYHTPPKELIPVWAKLMTIAGFFENDPNDLIGKKVWLEELDKMHDSLIKSLEAVEKADGMGQLHEGVIKALDRVETLANEIQASMPDDGADPTAEGSAP